MRAALLAIALLGCGPKAPPQNLLKDAPKLPAPRASAYVSVQSEPSDPAVARLTRGRPWNESLAGAAAGLALDWSDGRGDLSGWEVRESAWQAGWPWPILEVRGWMTRQAEPPPEELLEWLDTFGEEDQLGLVRARGRQGDAWVALRSHPRGSMGVQPRQVQLDEQLTFAPQPGVELTVADPLGNVNTMSLAEERVVHADVAGEWLVELRDAKGMLALFPVYAGLVPPEAKVLARRASRVTTPEEAANGFREILTEVREVYGLAGYEDDLLIQTAAASILGGRTATSTRDIARKLGYAPERTWKITCRARTLTNCADQILWNPRARPALFAQPADIGLAAELVGDQVHVVVLVAAH